MKRFDWKRKTAGVLAPLFALRSEGDLGIGDTSSLMDFVDWAAHHGFGVVQILPINAAAGDYSPYNPVSSVALEPITLRTTPAALQDLTPEDYQEIAADHHLSDSKVDYATVDALKHCLLERSFENFSNRATGQEDRQEAFETFQQAERSWLEGYSMFQSLRERNENVLDWREWPEEHRTPERARHWLEQASKDEAQSLNGRMRYHAYVQWQAAQQWAQVRDHAEAQGVFLMGDIPFGIGRFSCDAWCYPDLFVEGWYGGTPPDRYFKHDPFVQKWGQNWGIPLYQWEAEGAFKWWRQRVGKLMQYFHLLRIDHILGFYRIYGFPWGPELNAAYLQTDREHVSAEGKPLPRFWQRPDDTPEHQAGNKADGEKRLRAIIEEVGEGRLIGEDLGEIPPYLQSSLSMLRIAGYKIPQWEPAFDDPGASSEGCLPSFSVATYGTHDHDPVRNLWTHYLEDSADEAVAQEKKRMMNFARLGKKHLHAFDETLHGALAKALLASESALTIFTITDLLGSADRINKPGVSDSENWTVRMSQSTRELYGDPLSARWSEWIRDTGR